MKDLGTYTLELNKEYDDEMKRHINLNYVTSTYQYVNGEYI